MLRTSAIQAMKILASETFRLGKVLFNGFEDIKDVTINKSIEIIKNDSTVVNKESTNQLDIWADLSIEYEGTPPESYRVLNSMIMDWVDDNEKSLKSIINPKLVPFLNEKYNSIDTSDLIEDFDDYIWEDQVDYFPELNEENKKIDFSLEMVLEVKEDDSNDENDDASE